jgi:hypothetical protein
MQAQLKAIISPRDHHNVSQDLVFKGMRRQGVYKDINECSKKKEENQAPNLSDSLASSSLSVVSSILWDSEARMASTSSTLR